MNWPKTDALEGLSTSRPVLGLAYTKITYGLKSPLMKFMVISRTLELIRVIYADSSPLLT